LILIEMRPGLFAATSARSREVTSSRRYLIPQIDDGGADGLSFSSAGHTCPPMPASTRPRSQPCSTFRHSVSGAGKLSYLSRARDGREPSVTAFSIFFADAMWTTCFSNRLRGAAYPVTPDGFASRSAIAAIPHWEKQSAGGRIVTEPRNSISLSGILSAVWWRVLPLANFEKLGRRGDSPWTAMFRFRVKANPDVTAPEAIMYFSGCGLRVGQR